MAKEKKEMIFKSIGFWLVLILIVILMYNFQSMLKKVVNIPYSQFIKELNAQNISSVMFREKKVEGFLKQEKEFMFDERGHKIVTNKFISQIPFEDPKIIDKLQEYGVEIKADDKNNIFISILSYIFPFILFLGIWMFILRQMQSSNNRALAFGKSRAKLQGEKRTKVTFNDVAGVDEAKAELQEIIEFLKEPKKFQKLGGKIPRGVLLIGPPGSGKTLLAKAVAGESGVPFFSISGSDFVEMFVGVGASRVRDLFEQGKRNAPCIIFIDELDAVGRHRGAGLGGGHDEREQTLNQLLVEMDGFDPNEGVILISATNRPDVLDPALLRPGRFDRRIVVDNPDVKGREGILNVHIRNIALSKEVDLKVLARGTPGFSGADLANMVNEAALLAARKGKEVVEMIDFEEAKDKVIMGPERKSLVLTDNEKKNSAYHEAGHALVAHFVPNIDPIHKVTIIPRGQALGATHLLPIEEKHTYRKEYLLSQIVVLLGGRAAEEIVFNDVSNGAGNDIKRATELVKRMVCQWGMSEKLGTITYGRKHEEVFLGRDILEEKDYSDETARQIDEEIKKMLDTSYTKAKEIITQNRDKLEIIAKLLIEKEVLDGSEITKVLEEKKDE